MPWDVSFAGELNQLSNVVVVLITTAEQKRLKAIEVEKEHQARLAAERKSEAAST
jgi:hypothetical protein